MYSVSFKKPKSGKLFNVLCVRATNEIQASKTADKVLSRDRVRRKYIEYGITKHKIKIGESIAMFQVVTYKK